MFVGWALAHYSVVEDPRIAGRIRPIDFHVASSDIFAFCAAAGQRPKRCDPTAPGNREAHAAAVFSCRSAHHGAGGPAVALQEVVLEVNFVIIHDVSDASTVAWNACVPPYPFSAMIRLHSDPYGLTKQRNADDRWQCKTRTVQSAFARPIIQTSLPVEVSQLQCRSCCSVLRRNGTESPPTVTAGRQTAMPDIVLRPACSLQTMTGTAVACIQLSLQQAQIPSESEPSANLLT